MADRLAAMRSNWDKFAVRFTETANKRMSLQCARQLHAHLQLDQGASSVLEVAAGAGLGSLDIAKYLTAQNNEKLRKKLTVTDFSPVMVGLARETLKPLTSGGLLDVKVMEANALDLVGVPTASVDRYVAGLTLQLVPDADAMLKEAYRVLTPDGLAGFTIWANPENSGMFAINAAANAELGLEQSGEHSNFVLSKDLRALRARFRTAGFPSVRIWPFQCVVESWSGASFADFHREAWPLEEHEKELNDKRFEIVRRLADEWLASKGIPIGLETYVVLASKKELKTATSRV